MKNYLLIIGCSQRKVDTRKPLPAIELYDGPTYQILRKAKREGRFPDNLDIFIISAKYGLLTSEQPIDLYNRLMSLRRARQLRPIIQEELKSWIDTKRGGYAQVFINLGEVYMQTLIGFDWDLVSTMEASGGIGQRGSQMKAWLEQIANDKDKET